MIGISDNGSLFQKIISIKTLYDLYIISEIWYDIGDTYWNQPICKTFLKQKVVLTSQARR